MKIGYSQNKNVKQLKKIIQTLSKQIPNSQHDDNKHYLDKFNKINTNIEALELLNKRLSDLLPHKRDLTLCYGWSDMTGHIVNGNISETSNPFETYLYTLNADWSEEYDTTQYSNYQYKRIFIPKGVLTIRAKNSQINTYNELYIADIYEGDTKNYTEINGYLPCRITNIGGTNQAKNGLIYFNENMVYLICDDWSWLNETDIDFSISFNGCLQYKSYEDYTTKTK